MTSAPPARCASWTKPAVPGSRRVVYAASSSAYGDQPGALRTEDDPLLPLSPYAAAKLAGEHYCSCCTAVYGLETVRLRFFNVFGPRQDAKSPYSGVIALFIAAMNQGRAPTIFGDGLQTRDFVYVENVVQALILAADAPGRIGQVYNIGNGQGSTLLDLVHHLNELLSTSIQPQFEPPRAGDIRHSAADISRARRDLAYEPPVSFREGLARTLTWAQVHMRALARLDGAKTRTTIACSAFTRKPQTSSNFRKSIRTRLLYGRNEYIKCLRFSNSKTIFSKLQENRPWPTNQALWPPPLRRTGDAPQASRNSHRLPAPFPPSTRTSAGST